MTDYPRPAGTLLEPVPGGDYITAETFATPTGTMERFGAPGISLWRREAGFLDTVTSLNEEPNSQTFYTVVDPPFRGLNPTSGIAATIATDGSVVFEKHQYFNTSAAFAFGKTTPDKATDLGTPTWELMPANGSCFTNRGQPFGYLAGLTLNSGPVGAGHFTAKAWLSPIIYCPFGVFLLPSSAESS